ncbi:hypothetical protein ICN48_10900 [Polynucleobacter sp. JS-Safj-400b-B2]|uniref:nodulation protein NodZ n=1 Tax=Polynucleobacter sp. JS-Safj-400b-B2 TaxID=2576921 RepID=UPI001C0E4BFF|nr:nodulation protein NodZ [Polynucleobacter sp. JS-Safj-400b-B2]MBU3626739.1 hypothetical protein [Polynucleobacter sp. JS-Safj-400b-B2]
MHIVSKRDSGLGDMLSHLSHSIWLAKSIGATVYPDWRNTRYHDPESLGLNYFLDFFYLEDVPYTQTLLDVPKDITILPYREALSIGGSCPPYFEPPIFETYGLTGTVPAFDIFVSSKVLDFLSQPVQFQYMRNIKITETIKKQCNEVLQDMRRFDGNIFGVHIRHGNGELYAVGSKEETLLFNRYEKILNQLLQQNKNLKFFLFTDSQIVINWFEKKFGSVFKNPNARFPKSIGEPMHFNVYKELAGHNILQWSVQDLYLMSQLDGLICESWSAFPRWAIANSSQTLLNNLLIIKSTDAIDDGQ